jgi:hypothetical protein
MRIEFCHVIHNMQCAANQSLCVRKQYRKWPPPELKIESETVFGLVSKVNPKNSCGGNQIYDTRIV